MTLSAFLKPALAAIAVVALGAAWYWFEHRSHPEEKETPSNALVIVTKSTNACFSDLVKVTGFIVPRREAVVGVDQEGSKVADVLVREGETVADNQELARLTPPPAQPGAAGGRPAPTSLRAPAAGLVTEVKTIVGAPASPQSGPMFRISVNNEIELDAEVPAIHVMKLNAGATVRIRRDGCGSGSPTTTPRKFSRASTRARSSWPMLAPRCMTATRSRPCSPRTSIERGYADGFEYLGMVDPEPASLDRILHHPLGAGLGQLYQTRGNSAALGRHPRDLGRGRAVRRGPCRT